MWKPVLEPIKESIQATRSRFRRAFGTLRAVVQLTIMAGHRKILMDGKSYVDIPLPCGVIAKVSFKEVMSYLGIPPWNWPNYHRPAQDTIALWIKYDKAKRLGRPLSTKQSIAYSLASLAKQSELPPDPEDSFNPVVRSWPIYVRSSLISGGMKTLLKDMGISTPLKRRRSSSSS